MEISRIRALRGPNLWSRHTAIEAVVSCTGPERELHTMPQFEARLCVRFPEINSLEPAGHDGSVSLAHALAIVALELQSRAGCPVTFSQTVHTPEAGVYQVVVEYSEESVGRLAFRQAIDLLRSAVEDTPFDLAGAIDALRDLDEEIRLGPSTGAIVEAALEQGIPYRRLTEGSLVQFGWGSRQRRIQAAETDGCSAIAESIAQNKDLTKMLLEAAGVPVPAGRAVGDAEDAWAAACEIGVPVVIKPRDGNQGKGIAVNISTREDVIAAYAAAARVDDDVLVERYLPGCDFRLLVVGDALVAAARRDPPQLIGDGKHCIRQLIENINSDPLRGEGHATSLTKISLDDIALATLARQGHDADSIPAKGARVVLRNNANLSTGGIATDVTDDVHPAIASQAIAAAQMVGLDICGVDIVCDSIYRPLEAQGGAIVEVNAAPGLRMHIAPSFGKSRPVGKAIVDSLFPNRADGRIPIVAVAGTNGKTTTVRLTTHLLSGGGFRVGMTNSDGVYIAGKRIDSGDCSGPKSARNVLMHPDVDAAVLETARGGILREGLAFDRCDVAIVTNIGMGDHLGLSYISSVEDLAVVKQVIVKNVAPGGTAVLNAGDPMVAAMADACPGAILYFCSDPHHPLIVTHRARHQRVVFATQAGIHAAEGQSEVIIPWADIPITRNGTLPFQVENAMAAVSAAWTLGLDWNTIVSGLSSFVGDPATTPGRFNLFDYGGATVIADYGHNPDAILALVKAIESIPAKRRMVVISGAGDRRDEDILQQTEILGAAFDEVILYEDQCQRGRADGEVLGLLRTGLAGASRTRKISEIRGEFAAIDLALSHLAPEDLCLILIDQVDEALEHIGHRTSARKLATA